MWINRGLFPLPLVPLLGISPPGGFRCWVVKARRHPLPILLEVAHKGKHCWGSPVFGPAPKV
jgi:hypothetical protein